MFDQQKIPNVYFFCTGKSHGETSITSFDGALLKAGIGNINLIKVSSIVPPACQEVKPFPIPQGVLLPIAYASITSNNEEETISSAVAVAIPADPSLAGVIMEHSGCSALTVVETEVIDMVEEAMSMRGIKDYVVKSDGIEDKVGEWFATTFAGLVLWWKS